MNKIRHLEKLVKERCLAGNLQLEEAVSLFHRLLSPDTHHPPSILTINLLLKSIAGTKHPSRYSSVLNLFNRLRRTRDRGVSLTIQTFGLVIDCCRQMGRVDHGFCVLGQSLREGCGVNTIMFGSLIRGLCTRKQMRHAAKVLAKMPLLGFPDVYTYNDLILGFCNVGDIDQAFDVYEKVVNSGLQANVYIYTTLLKGCCKEGDFLRASELLHEMIKRGVAPNVHTYTCLIHGLSAIGEWNRAIRVFREMVNQGISPDVVTFNALMNSLCKHRRTCEAEKLVCLMEDIRVEPDVITCTALLLGYVLESHLAKATELLERMASIGIEPDQHCYSILINSCCKNGKINDALRMVDKMMHRGLKPNEFILDILLNALSNCKNPDEVKQIISEIGDRRSHLDDRKITVKS
ncbi:hypothetical protein LUZ63_015858 [Rhynchospora breviuscula]|uniref:Pentatricopeptide repeat-containing protein n=1 Tax=Rhynchospora breviuscula TaxID=2022672 RepID=A0A9Q0CD35_9POAL|nr:hypothetical protein LUZ63_015858 [Rhynchospora breviuscula]